MIACYSVWQVRFAICVFVSIFLNSSLIQSDGADWPPLSRELVQRIEVLPRERAAVAKAADELISRSKSEVGEAHIVDHWKPLLIVLMGRAEGLDRQEAEKRYEEMMDDVGLFTQSALEGEEGVLTAAAVHFIIPTRRATENLLAHYVRKVMVDDHWDLDQWIEWNARWRMVDGGEIARADDEEVDLPFSIIGHWEAQPEMGMFAYAVVTPARFLLIWQESNRSPVRKIDIANYRLGDEKIYSGDDDIGLPYLFSRDSEGREFLHFEVRSEERDLLKTEVGLIRSDTPAVARP